MAHWAWSEKGWASPSNDAEHLLFDCGAIDFAGSGVVHVTGGLSALVGITVLGPRAGRFNEDGTYNTMPQQSAVLQVRICAGNPGLTCHTNLSMLYLPCGGLECMCVCALVV